LSTLPKRRTPYNPVQPGVTRRKLCGRERGGGRAGVGGNREEVREEGKEIL